MTKESDQLDQTEASSSVNGPRARQSSTADLMSPVLYDIVMWGFAEINACGQRVLRRDIQARLDDHQLTEQELDDFEGSPPVRRVPVSVLLGSRRDPSGI